VIEKRGERLRDERPGERFRETPSLFRRRPPDRRIAEHPRERRAEPGGVPRHPARPGVGQTARERSAVDLDRRHAGSRGVEQPRPERELGLEPGPAERERRGDGTVEGTALLVGHPG